jgi:hypothetical protein
MAPLSHDLAGLILPYDYFGSHLDPKTKKTVDMDLEQRNFERAGKVLAEVWSSTVINKYPVIAEWTGAGGKPELHDPSAQWIFRHVSFGQYCLQIRKCEKVECCSKPRTLLHSLLPDGFMPGPLPISLTEEGL